MCNQLEVKVIHRFKNHKGELYEVAIKKFSNKGDEKGAIGLCDPPDKDGALIKIEESLCPREKMIVAIHEMAHAFFWEASETNVDRFAYAVVSLLKRMGYNIPKWKKKANAHSHSHSLASKSQTSPP